MTNYYYENIYWRGTDLWMNFAGKKIFVAGSTGFYGSWFSGFLEYLRDVKKIPLEVESRSKSTNWLINDCTTYTDFQHHADYVLNCVGSSAPNLGKDEMLNQHVAGPISMASFLKKEAVFLQISSGVVDESPLNVAQLETYRDAKKTAEWFLRDMDANVRIVRPFATVGPGMGLEKHFAISNFIRLKLAGKPIEVLNRPITRSFVHITDLMVQMFHVLFQNSRTPFEVGSDDGISMLEAAKLISDDIILVDKDFPTNAQDVYVADLTNIKSQFNLGLDFDSKSAIMNTYNHYAAQSTALSHS